MFSKSMTFSPNQNLLQKEVLNMSFKLYKKGSVELLGESSLDSPREAAIRIIQTNVAVNNNEEISQNEIIVEWVDENSFRVMFKGNECILRKTDG